jgi:hypothetical protein
MPYVSGGCVVLILAVLLLFGKVKSIRNVCLGAMSFVIANNVVGIFGLVTGDLGIDLASYWIVVFLVSFGFALFVFKIFSLLLRLALFAGIVCVALYLYDSGIVSVMVSRLCGV